MAKYVTKAPVQVWSSVWPIRFGKRDIIGLGKLVESSWGDHGYAFIESPTKGWVALALLEKIIDIPPLPPPPPVQVTRPLFPPFLTPKAGRLIQFCWDRELDEWGHKSRVVQKNYKAGALPSTVHLDGKPDYVPLTEPWQKLAFELIRWQDNGRNTHEALIEAYKSVYLDRRAMTDQHAWNTAHEENGVWFTGYHDYVLGTNVMAKDVAQLRLAMSGNIANALTGGTKIAFAAFATSQPCPKIEDVWGDHTKVWWCTESNRPDWFNNGRVDVTGRWPQLGKYGVPFLNISFDGINFVRSDKVRRLGNDVAFSPYDPQ